MTLENFYVPSLQFGDTRITGSNVAGAVAHGYDRAEQVVGKYLSQLQPKEYRHAAMRRYFLREHGYSIGTEYATVMRAPCGTLIGHRRERLAVLRGHGQDTYLIRVEEVRELSPVAMPDLEVYGLTVQEMYPVCGRYTYADVEEQLASDNLTLPFAETFRNILTRVVELSTQLNIHDCVDDPYGLSAALSGRFAWTLYGRSPGQVTVHQSCHCGWVWHSKHAWPAECPRCRTERPKGPSDDLGRISHGGRNLASVAWAL